MESITIYFSTVRSTRMVHTAKIVNYTNDLSHLVMRKLLNKFRLRETMALKTIHTHLNKINTNGAD